MNSTGLISVEAARAELQTSLKPFRELAASYDTTAVPAWATVAARIREVIAKSESDFEEFLNRAKAEFVTRQ